MKSHRVRRARWRYKIDSQNARRLTASCTTTARVPLFVASSSSSVDNCLQSAFISGRSQVSGKAKFYSRVLLPLTLLVLLFVVVGFLWVPQRNARRPYSSLAGNHSSALEISFQGISLRYYNSPDRRLSDIVSGYRGKSMADFGSSLAGRCYDKGGPSLCSRSDACAKHSLLCKCTCISST